MMGSDLGFVRRRDSNPNPLKSVARFPGVLVLALIRLLICAFGSWNGLSSAVGFEPLRVDGGGVNRGATWPAVRQPSRRWRSNLRPVPEVHCPGVSRPRSGITGAVWPRVWA